jgi:hypothetical protein
MENAVDENNFGDDKKITGALNLVLQHTSLQYGFVIQVCRLYNTSKITWHAQIFKNVSAIVDLLGGCGINIQFIIMDAHTAHNNVFYNQDIIKIGDKQIKVIRDAFHLIKNFGNILLRKEALYFDGTKFILQGNYSKNELQSNKYVINFFSDQTFRNVYANNIAEQVFDKHEQIFMAIVNLVQYLSNETVISEAFRELLITFHSLFESLDNNIMYMGNLAEQLLSTIEEFNIELCASLTSVEAEKLFSARSGPHL